ncbi:MAG: hypothetical protein FJY76_03560 [Candidatus Aenigmarchaeota archaeon]|nr:hypothetical protein [Candidatus Aenigmarchaeota archaeon]
MDDVTQRAEKAFRDLGTYARISGHDTSVFDDPNYRTLAVEYISAMLDVAHALGIIDGHTEGVSRMVELNKKRAGHVPGEPSQHG